MKLGRSQHGFTLIEVLFAVVILTMGLVFVASQFPMALSMSRDIAETTKTKIDTHNAQVMLELRLGSIAGSGVVAPGGFIDNSVPGGVKFLYQPNIRVGTDPCDYVMDDPHDPSAGFFNLASGFLDGDVPDSAFNYKGKVPSYFKTTDTYGYLQGSCFGRVVMPGVMETDPEVQDLLPTNFLDLDVKEQEDELGIAIAKVVRTRTYCTSMLYRCENSTTSGGTFHFYIFLLRRAKEGSRYAMQDNSFPDWAKEPAAFVESEDRYFPVPWFVSFHKAINPRIEDYEDLDPHDDIPPPPRDRVILNDYTDDDGNADAIANILREDSVLVDSQHGHIYRVEEISRDDDDTYWIVRFNRELVDVAGGEHLQSFWVFPPAVIGDEEYADQQPVVDVVEKVIRL